LIAQLTGSKVQKTQMISWLGKFRWKFLFKHNKTRGAQTMLNPTILKDGLSIILSCKKETGDIWHAHFGAAAIASLFLLKTTAWLWNTKCSICL
jgi:hypothetical protein